MPIRTSGRHELGQNFLRDRATIARIVELARERPGPLVEWGTGNGAITVELATLDRPLHGIEIDRRRARELGRRVGPHVCISAGDILRHAPPAGSVVVANVPFHLTTPILRHLLALDGLAQRDSGDAVGGRPQTGRRGRRHPADRAVLALVRLHARPAHSRGRVRTPAVR